MGWSRLRTRRGRLRRSPCNSLRYKPPLRKKYLDARPAYGYPERSPKAPAALLFNVDGSFVLLHGGDSTAETSESAHGVQVEGTVRIHKLDVRHMAGWLGMPPISTGFVAPAQLVAQVRLVPRPAGYDLIVGEWGADPLELSLQGTATVAGLGTEIPACPRHCPPLPCRSSKR